MKLKLEVKREETSLITAVKVKATSEVKWGLRSRKVPGGVD